MDYYKPDTNLYHETNEALSNNNKSWADVSFISIIDKDSFFIEVEDFIEYSKNVNYYRGYGSVEISDTLKIVGDGWWLERWEYDGSEGWSFKQMPTKPKKKFNIAKELLIGNKIHL